MRITDLRRRAAAGLPATAAGRRLAVMTLIDAVGTGAFLTISAIFLTRDIGLPAPIVGLGLSLAAIVGLVTTVPVGVLADRYGARRLLVIVSAWRTLWFASYVAVHDIGSFFIVVCALGLVDKTGAPLEQALVGRAVESTERVRTMAVMRALRNAGFTAGALIGSIALALDDWRAYDAVVLVNAASFGVLAVLASRLRLPDGPARDQVRLFDYSLRAFRDRSYVALAGLNAILTTHMSLLSVGIPVWIAVHTRAPRITVAALLAVNTVLAVALQVRASRRAGTVAGAARALKTAGLALATCCLLVAVARPMPAAAAIVLLLAGIIALTAAELLQSAAAWGLSYALAPRGQEAAYLSVFGLSVGFQQVVAPIALLAFVIPTGYPGWVTIAAITVITGLAVPRVTEWAAANRPSPPLAPALGLAPAPAAASAQWERSRA